MKHLFYIESAYICTSKTASYIETVYAHERKVILIYCYTIDILLPTPVKQVVVAAIVTLSNICRAWTMYLCMDSVKFLLEVPSASILWRPYYFVTTPRPFWNASTR